MFKAHLNGSLRARQRCGCLSPWMLTVLLMAPAWSAEPELRESLRHRLEVAAHTGQPTAGGEFLFAVTPLRALYEQRGWQPIWFDQRRELLPRGHRVLAALDRAADHGLEPAHYHRTALSDLLERFDGDLDAGAILDFELLASDALVTLAHHLSGGRIDPETIDPGWFIEREPLDLADTLERAAEGRLSADDLMAELLPLHREYRLLVDRLALHRELLVSGDWPVIPGGALIRPGDHDPRLDLIAQRLAILGDLADPPETFTDPYDDELQAAVRRFQYRHGLARDGIIGPQTLAALNVSPRARFDQIRANLERWRWLPRSLGEEHVLVNIAGFSMQVVSDGETVMRQRAIVGLPYRRTPVFSGRISYLVINPSWEVPPRLAAQDQLPRIRANPDYLEEMGFSVLQGWGSEERRIDPTEIDWQALSSRHFPYRLRQAPGPANALGQVKFMFPNRHNVYLHDTPARGLFVLEERALSSGCIRLEDAPALAHWLLAERSAILSPQRIAATFDSGRETTVRLDRPLPVHLLYWTAWVDDHNLIHYRRDIYQRDQRLIEALNASPPDPPNLPSADPGDLST